MPSEYESYRVDGGKVLLQLAHEENLDQSDCSQPGSLVLVIFAELLSA